MLKVDDSALDGYLTRRQPPHGPAYVLWLGRRIVLVSLFVYLVPIAGAA